MCVDSAIIGAMQWQKTRCYVLHGRVHNHWTRDADMFHRVHNNTCRIGLISLMKLQIIGKLFALPQDWLLSRMKGVMIQFAFPSEIFFSFTTFGNLLLRK